MNRLVIPLFLLAQTMWIAAGHAAEATASDVYAQALRIEQEVALLKRHLNVTGKTDVATIRGAELRLEHVWAGGYIVLLKLSKLRRQLGLPYIEPISIEPVLDMPMNSVWDLNQRIIGEIGILKFYLDIPGQTPAAAPVAGKRPLDAYNKLAQISGELDLLSSPVTVGDVYSEAKRIDAEVDAMLRQLRIVDTAVPPPRPENALPGESQAIALSLLEEVLRIERAYGMAVTEFKGFDTGKKATSGDVLILVEMVIAEMERIKARSGLTHRITVPSSYTQDKSPADLAQLLGYITNKLREIGPR